MEKETGNLDILLKEVMDVFVEWEKAKADGRFSFREVRKIIVQALDLRDDDIDLEAAVAEWYALNEEERDVFLDAQLYKMKEYKLVVDEANRTVIKDGVKWLLATERFLVSIRAVRANKEN